jgi:[ribosomal protein S5]-alanine N-acetyltransferase
MERRLPTEFRTQRLLLRAPLLGDGPKLFAAYTQDTEVAHFMVWRPHKSVAESNSFVAECVRAWSLGQRLPYVLALAENPVQPIGMLEARLAERTVDIGYVLAREMWGQGFVPEAIEALTQYALLSGGFYRVQATCDVENRGSYRALEKSGFLREGVLSRHTVHPNVSSEPRACYMYAKSV